jgi:hypothetical protein
MSFCSENSKKRERMGDNDRVGEVYELATHELRSIHGGLLPAAVIIGIALPTKGQIARRLIMNWFRPTTVSAPGTR